MFIVLQGVKKNNWIKQMAGLDWWDVAQIAKPKD